jgi:hypothetical protein
VLPARNVSSWRHGAESHQSSGSLVPLEDILKEQNHLVSTVKELNHMVSTVKDLNHLVSTVKELNHMVSTVKEQNHMVSTLLSSPMGGHSDWLVLWSPVQWEGILIG